MKLGFVVDSTFNVKEEKGTKVVPLKVIIDGKEYVDGKFDYSLVIEGLKEERDIKTSQPSPEQFIKAINELLNEGYEKVVVLTLSKTLSGTYNSAILARDTLQNENVLVFDSFTTIQGGKWILEQVRNHFDKTNDFIDSLELMSEFIARGFLLFTVNDLSTLVKNGRLSKVKAIIGNILRIKPILKFEKGKLDVVKKVRSFNGMLSFLKSKISNFLEEGFHTYVRIEYVETDEQANDIKRMVEKLDKNIIVDICGVISPVVSSHVGLGGLGIYVNKVEKV